MTSGPRRGRDGAAQNKRAVQRRFDEVWNTRRIEVIPELYSPTRRLKSIWDTIQTPRSDSPLPAPPRTSSGRLPRPLPRRLQAPGIGEMVAACLSGDTVNDLAQQFGVHRTTVMAHLARREANRPDASKAQWNDDTLGAAARLYADGASLSDVGARFGVHASTVANRFHQAGIQIRPRRGWS